MEQHQLKLDALDQFESGESFLSGFTSGSYDLIFLDIYMTGITTQFQIQMDARRVPTPTPPNRQNLKPKKAEPITQ